MAPPDLVEFWLLTESVRLFEDQQYSQWGLVIQSPEDAVSLTQQSRDDNPGLVRTDLVIGEFLGDSDLLAVRCNPDVADYGCVIIASAIDPRADWEIAAKSLHEFLDRFINSGGEKYWE